jgi:hypothetical protein
MKYLTFFIIPILLLFSCSSCEPSTVTTYSGHMQVSINGYNYEAFGNEYEGGHEIDDLRILGLHYNSTNPNSTQYAMAMGREIGVQEFAMIFDPEEPYREGIELHTVFPAELGVPRVEQVAFINKDPNAIVTGSIVSNVSLNVGAGSWASLDINEVEGSDISGVFDFFLAWQDIYTGVLHDFNSNSGTYSNVRIMPI